MAGASELIAEGRRRLAAGDRVGAEAWLAQVEPASPQRLEALLALGRLHMGAGTPAAAEPWLREASERDGSAWFPLGACLLAQNKAEEAMAAFDRALASAPSDVPALVMRAHCLVALGRPADAVRTLDQALKADPRHEAARFFLAESLVRLGDLKRADLQLHYVIKLKPSYGPAIALRGEIFRRLGNHRQAVRELMCAHILMPDDAGVLTKLGESFAGTGDAAQALFAFEAAIARDPGRGTAYLGAANQLATVAGAAEARRYYLAAAKLPGLAAEAEAGLARLQALLAAAEPPTEPAESPPTVPRLTAFHPLPTELASGTRPITAPISTRPGTVPLRASVFTPRSPTASLRPPAGQSGDLAAPAALGAMPGRDVTPLPGPGAGGTMPLAPAAPVYAATGTQPISASGPLAGAIPPTGGGAPSAPMAEVAIAPVAMPGSPGNPQGNAPFVPGPGSGEISLAGPAIIDEDGMPPVPTGALSRRGTGPLSAPTLSHGNGKRSGLGFEPGRPVGRGSDSLTDPDPQDAGPGGADDPARRPG